MMRLILFLTLLFLATILHAQQLLHPFKTYVLPALPTHTHAALARTPQQDILILTAQLDGKWELTRVSGWLTSNPTQERLQIENFPKDIRSLQTRQQPPLLVSPDGRYAIAAASLLLSHSPSHTKRLHEDFAALIDLKQFKVLSIAKSQASHPGGTTWAFNENGVLMLAQESVTFPEDDLFTAKILVLPELTSAQTCEFHRVSVRPRQIGLINFSKGCDDFVKAAKITSLASLFPPRTISKISGREMPEDWREQTSSDGLLAAQEENDGHLNAFDTMSLHRAWIDLWSVPEKKKIAEIDLLPKTGAPWTLASGNNINYVVVLQKSKELSTYVTPGGWPVSE